MNRIDSTENNTVRNRIKLFNHNLSPLEKRKIPFWLLLAAARIYLLSRPRLPFCFFFFFFFLFDNLAPASSPMKCHSLAEETRDIYYPLRLEEKETKKKKKYPYILLGLCVCVYVCVDSPSILSPDWTLISSRSWCELDILYRRRRKETCISGRKSFSRIYTRRKMRVVVVGSPFHEWYAAPAKDGNCCALVNCHLIEEEEEEEKNLFLKKKLIINRKRKHTELVIA